jgi:hypothetical protein
MRHYSESRQDKDIDFRVAKKPKEMLVLKGVSSTIRIIKTSILISIC